VKLNPELQWWKQHSGRSRLFVSKLDLNLSKKPGKCYIWSIAIYWNLGTAGSRSETPVKFWNVVLEEGWISAGPILWKMKKYRTQSRRTGMSYIQRKKRKANRVGYVLRRNCLLKHVIEGRIEGRKEVAGRRERRRATGWPCRNEGYWKLQEEALDHTLRRKRFGRDYGPVVRQTTEWIN
jgi:hypothetical protein